MSEHTRTSLADKHTNSKKLSPKKQQKRYHKLEEDLADAQEALEEAQEDLQEAQQRVQRIERRVQKRSARIVKIKQKILAARVELGEDVSSDPETVSWLPEEEDVSSMLQTDEIPAINPLEVTPEASSTAPAITEEETAAEPVASVPTEEMLSPVAVVEETTEAPLVLIPEELSSESIATESEAFEKPIVSGPEAFTPVPAAVVEETIDAPVEPTNAEPTASIPAKITPEPVTTLEPTNEEPAASIPQEIVSEPATLVEETAEEPLASIQEVAPSETSTTTEQVEISTSTPTVQDDEPTELVSESALEEVSPLLDTADLAETSEPAAISPSQQAPVEASELPAPLDEQKEDLSAPTAASPAPVAPTYGLRAASAPAERQTDEIVAVRVPSSLHHPAPIIDETSTPLQSENSTETPVSSSNPTLPDLPIFDEQDQSTSTFTAIAQAQEKVVTVETQGVIDEANMVAEAAEEAADLAAERLFEFEQRLDQFVAGRHLEQDLAQLQAEVERTERFALQARQAVTDVETQTSLVEPAPLPFVQPQAELFDAEAAPLEIPVPPASDPSAQSEIPTIEDAPSEDAPSIEEIDRQEEALEAAVSASLTDDAQQESEHAEAYAEASGARAQEARTLVERVSMMVDMVVAAIDSGILIGTNADEALAAAEQEMSSAQAILTALNIITERADSYSADVEARAEVSGGMSYASEENWRQDTRLSNDLAEIEHEPA